MNKYKSGKTIKFKTYLINNVECRLHNNLRWNKIFILCLLFYFILIALNVIFISL